MEKKQKINKSTITFLQWLIAIMLIIASLCIIIVSVGDGKKEDVVSIKENGSFDYQVYLKPNDYFQVPFLKKEERYITALTNQIKVKLKYQLSISQNMNLDANYRIDAILDVRQKENEKKQLWTKQFVIKPTSEVLVKDKNHLEVTDEITLDFNSYMNLLHSFKNSYQIDIEAELKLHVYIDTVGKMKQQKENMEKNAIMSLSIPMTETTFEITESMNFPLEEQTILESSEDDIQITYIPLFILGCFLLSASTIVFVYRGLELLQDGKKEHSYLKERNKILRKYDSVIVNAKKMPDIEGLSMIEVSSFEELLDAEEELHSPIIFIEIIPGSVGWFMILYQNQVWRYVLKVKVK